MTGSNGQIRIRRPRGDSGASLVEFAVIAPLLLLVLLGIIEFARLGLATTEIRTAAREGARYATVVGDSDGNGLPNFVDCAGIVAAAKDKIVTQAAADVDIDVDYLPGGHNCDGGIPFPSGDVDSGTRVVVDARATFDSIVPLVGAFLDGIDIESQQSRTINYEANS